MRLHFPPTASALAALGGVPLLFGLFVLWSYRYSLARGGLPLTVLPEWLWFLGFGFSLLLGLAAVLALPLKRPWLRLAAALAYLPAMALVLLLVHLLVACWNGDCL
jgi:hypothetical protein